MQESSTMEERIIAQTEIFTEDFTKNLKLIESNPMPPIQSFESANLVSVAKNSFEIIEEIKKTDLITEKDIENIKKAQAFLLTSYKNVPVYNTRISKVVSILSDAKFPTNDSKYWQCKMQAEVHFNELIRGFQKIDRANIDLEEIQYQIGTLDNIINSKENLEATKFDEMKLKFDRRRLVNKLNQYAFELKLLEKDVKQRLREINDWAEMAASFENSCNYSVTDYEDHTYESHLLSLKAHVDRAKTNEERKQYTDQLNTFLRLMGKQPIK